MFRVSNHTNRDIVKILKLLAIFKTYHIFFSSKITQKSLNLVLDRYNRVTVHFCHAITLVHEGNEFNGHIILQRTCPKVNELYYLPFISSIVGTEKTPVFTFDNNDTLIMVHSETYLCSTKQSLP